MSLWDPEDACARVACVNGTIRREGPSALSTFVIVFFAINVAATVLRMAILTSFWGSPRIHHTCLLVFLLALSLVVVGYVLYFRFYRQCRPWTGWFIFLGAGLLCTVIQQWAGWDDFVAAAVCHRGADRRRHRHHDDQCARQQQ